MIIFKKITKRRHLLTERLGIVNKWREKIVSVFEVSKIKKMNGILILTYP